MHSLDEKFGNSDSATQQNAGSRNPAGPTNDTESPSDSQGKSFFGIIIHSFFVVPFLIAVFGVLLFAAVRLLTLEQHTIYDYINDVKTGSLSKRWQSAFELSKALSNPKLVPTDERFVSELISAFEHSKHDDDRVRQYLALAMGRAGNPVFVKPLMASLQDEKSENLYAIIYALGILKDKSAAGPLRSFLDSPDARLRLAAVIALGDIAETNSIGPLKKALYDSEPNVQWDAAIALAKMRNPSGKDTLLKLLDRDYLSKFPEVDSEERKHILLVAINAAAMLDDAEINAAIQPLADNDQNMDVRKAALAVLKK